MRKIPQIQPMICDFNQEREMCRGKKKGTHRTTYFYNIFIINTNKYLCNISFHKLEKRHTIPEMMPLAPTCTDNEAAVAMSNK